MKSHIFTLILLIFCAKISAQQTGFPYMNQKGPVKQITTKTYKLLNDGTPSLLAGTEIKWHFEDMHLSNEDLPFMSEFFVTKWLGSITNFNKEGKITSHLADTRDGYMAEWTFKYDAQGKVYSESRNWINKEDNSKERSVYLYKYNSNNKLRYKMSEKQKEYFIWNGNKVYEEFTNDYRIIYCYGDKGLINSVVVIEQFGEDRYSIMNFHYQYNENGDIAVQKVTEGDRYQYWEFKYVYDSYGNWVKRYDYENGAENYSYYTQRFIEYY